MESNLSGVLREARGGTKTGTPSVPPAAQLFFPGAAPQTTEPGSEPGGHYAEVLQWHRESSTGRGAPHIRGVRVSSPKAKREGPVPTTLLPGTRECTDTSCVLSPHTHMGAAVPALHPLSEAREQRVTSCLRSTVQKGTQLSLAPDCQLPVQELEGLRNRDRGGKRG